MFQRKVFSIVFAGVAALGLSLLTGCGVGTSSLASSFASDSSGSSVNALSGILHGGPNPIVGATITLYTTGTTGYGSAATAVASTTTNSSGFFNLTLPSATIACPAGQYAYIGAYSGSTGSFSNNANSLMMVPIGACSSNYSVSGTSGNYTNTYTGSTLWIDELTTAVSAYALGNFMSVTNAGVINIGAPANNFATYSVGSTSAAPSAAGLAHAFQNALAILNTNTGQPNAYTNGGSSSSTGGVIPVAEINLLGNILQACVNSAGVTGTNTATSNDGSGCGILFSLTTPPQSGAAVPTNTMQAMLDLARYPNPGKGVATWNSTCTATGSSKTATSCIFGLAAPSGAYTNALTSSPPDFALAVVYTSGYGVQTSSCTGTCPGLTYPFYVALDYQDNVFVLNYDANAGTVPQGATTWSNVIGIAPNGAPIFSTPESTTYKNISIIGTDLASHVFGANTITSSPTIPVWSTTSGAVVGSASYNNSQPLAIAADPFNNLYVTSYVPTVNLRKFTYGGSSASPTYTVATDSAISLTTAGSPYQIAFDGNLDLLEYLDPAYDAGSGSPYACLLNNSTAATYTYMSAAPATFTNCTVGNSTAVAIPGNTGSSVAAAGIAATSTGALAVGSSGMTLITKTGNGSSATIAATSTTTIPPVNGNLYARYVAVDGNNWGYTVDGANGQVSGVAVFDAVDGLALGTYKGCFVTGGACGAANTPVSGQAPMASPRASAIDSAGDIWVVSGNVSDLTELIGAAAPTWPGLSMAKFGLPQ